MKLGENVHSISIGFHGNMHTVKLKRRNGRVYFDNNWYKFLTSANVVLGDICIFQRTKINASYRIAVLSKKLIDCYGIVEGIVFYNQLSNRLFLNKFVNIEFYNDSTIL